MNIKRYNFLHTVLILLLMFAPLRGLMAMQAPHCEMDDMSAMGSMHHDQMVQDQTGGHMDHDQSVVIDQQCKRNRKDDRDNTCLIYTKW